MDKEVKDYKEALNKHLEEESRVEMHPVKDCPHCGRCPTCGRPNYHPWYPYPYWYEHEPGYWTSEDGKTGNVTVRYS